MLGIAASRRLVKDVQAIDWEEAQVLATVLLRNIAKRFGSAQLFDRFNLDVADGELLCLLGPSGSGKTTLMRMIAGFEELDDGDIFVGDREISSLSPRDLDGMGQRLCGRNRTRAATPRRKKVRPPTVGRGLALERLLSERSLMTAEEIGASAEDWRRSYLHTPHGKPVNLRRNLPDIAMTEGEALRAERRKAPGGAG